MSRGRRHISEDQREAAGAASAATGAGLKQKPQRRLPWLTWIAAAGVLAGALIGGVVVALWLYTHVVVHIQIRDQPLGVMLPDEFNAIAKVTNDLEVAMDGQISTSVPFQQDLTVPFRGRYDFDVDMRADVPVAFEVVYDGILPIDTAADVTIRTGINYKNLKSLRNLVIETSLPLKFPLPVKLNIPVKDTIDLRYTGPLSADINQDVQTRVDTVLKTRLPINQTITTPVTAALPLTVYPRHEQVRLILSRMDIALRPSTMLGFSVTEDRQNPKRSDNVWGPLDKVAKPPPSER